MGVPMTTGNAVHHVREEPLVALVMLVFPSSHCSPKFTERRADDANSGAQKKNRYAADLGGDVPVGGGCWFGRSPSARLAAI